MKFTIIHNDHKKQLRISTKTVEALLERIAKDDSKQTVTRFREFAEYANGDYLHYKDMPTWVHIYPAAEFAKDENNNLKMKTCNGVLLLKFADITDADGVEGVKRSVAILPSTLAAIEGADGKSVIILVRFSDTENALPSDETEAAQLYRIAYQQIHPIYQAVVKASLKIGGPRAGIEASPVLTDEPSLHNSFMMTLDAHPYYNNKAVAMRIDCHTQAITEEQEQTGEPSDLQNVDSQQDDNKNSVRANITNMMQLLRGQYDFRYNTVLKCVEFRPKKKVGMVSSL